MHERRDCSEIQGVWFVAFRLLLGPNTRYSSNMTKSAVVELGPKHEVQQQHDQVSSTRAWPKTRGTAARWPSQQHSSLAQNTRYSSNMTKSAVLELSPKHEVQQQHDQVKNSEHHCECWPRTLATWNKVERQNKTQKLNLLRPKVLSYFLPLVKIYLSIFMRLN